MDVIGVYVRNHNDKRLHSAIGYVTPRDRLVGKDTDIHKAKTKKMRLVRMRRENIRAIGYLG